MAPNRPRDRADRGDLSVDADAVFEALASDRRRRVLRALRASVGAVTIETLARRVVERERTAAQGPVSAEGVKRVATRLYHADVPTLRDAALIEYDDRTREVRPVADLADLTDVLAAAFEADA